MNVLYLHKQCNFLTMSEKLLTVSEYISEFKVAGKIVKDTRTFIKRLDNGIVPPNVKKKFRTCRGYMLLVESE